jgi:hypothetical protein
MDKEQKIPKRINILRVRHVEVTPAGRVERELTGEELEQWKKEHGYDSTDNETESDTEQ